MADSIYLYKQTIDYLAGLIKDNIHNPGYKLPTESELIQELGISRMTATTAYHAINDTGVITRIRSKGTFIAPNASLDALEALGTKSSIKPSRKIGVILPVAAGSHTTKILSGILDSAPDKLFTVAITAMSQTSEQKHIQEMIADGIDGLILYPVDDDHYNSTLLNLAIKKFPVVLVDRHLPGLDFACVSSDDYAMIDLGLKRLLSHGHKDILFFNVNDLEPSSLSFRRNSYIEFLQNNNILTQYIYNCDIRHSTDWQNKLTAYLQEHPRISAIITADDSSSLCLFRYLHDRDQSLKSYEAIYVDVDNDIITDHFSKDITRIRQRSMKIGETAIKVLCEFLEKPSAKKEHILISPELLVGTNSAES